MSSKEKLHIGDTVVVDVDFGRPIGGKMGRVIEIKDPADQNCQSGIMVKIDIYASWLDRDWLIKIPKPNKMF